ncbi:MAG TPA: hypothetical protein VFN89_09475 [Solirubrobacterales bacterium]|nr:hypothetical protein [Solirubrobacterales bacterium]
MLDLPRYLLGVVEICLLGGFAWLGGSALRYRLLPGFSGAPGYLATALLALALLIWPAELLGSFGLFAPVPFLICVGVVGFVLRRGLGGGRGCPSSAAASSFSPLRHSRTGATSPGEKPSKQEGHPRPPTHTVAVGIALIVAALALVKFGVDVRAKLSTGMTGFDSTWYHGPFAAGFFQSGDTWGLHFIAPQFLAWFYPANAELFHAVGMLAFGRDLLSPLLNLGWLIGCLVACWCIGRPYRVAPWSLALGAIALSLPVLSDQAGEARNDIVGIFFLLAAVAIALNAWATAGVGSGRGPSRIVTTRSVSAFAVVGLAAGLAAGTKLNLLLPAAVLVVGLPLLAPAGQRLRALIAGALAALAGGGYWYLRNLIHAGNPLPWFDHLGPISLPAPEQALGGREGHTVAGYLTDGSVWSEWFLPGLHGALTILWPIVIALVAGALVLSLIPRSRAPSRFGPHSDQNLYGGRDFALLLAGLTGLATIAAWLIAPTSASGPDGMPRGFESGLRYLAPALVLGFALLPIVLSIRLRGAGVGCPPAQRRPLFRPAEAIGRTQSHQAKNPASRGTPHTRPLALGLIALLAAIAIGYPIQRHYLQNRYANPSFAAPGLNAAFEWADAISGARIATTSTRQYPLFGTDLSNHVQYVGERTPHGGFVAPTTCRQWRRLLDENHYDYVIATRDRIEPGKPPYPDTARWTEGPDAEPILRKPPTVVFKLTAPLDPSACPG